MGTNMEFTRTDLLHLLADAVREWTDDLLFQEQPGEKDTERYMEKDADTPMEFLPLEIRERKFRIFIMGLPEKHREAEEIPYILVQYLTSSDTGDENSACVSMIIALYNENDGEGGSDILRVIDRICFRLEKNPILGGKFLLMRDRNHAFETVIYHPDTMPYYFGEIQMYWRIPSVERDLTEWVEGIYQ